MSDFIKMIEDALDLFEHPDEVVAWFSSSFCQETQTIEAALSVLQKMASGDDWFDIESAPKDGTEILGLCNGWAAPFGTNSKREYTDIKTIISYEHNIWQTHLPYIHAEPTHWRHIDSATHIKMLLERELGNE